MNRLQKAIFIILICCCCPWLFSETKGIPTIELKYSLIKLADSIGCKLIFFDLMGKADYPSGPRFHFSQTKADVRIREYFKLLDNRDYEYSLDQNRKLLIVWLKKISQRKEAFLNLPIPPRKINYVKEQPDPAMTALNMYLSRNVENDNLCTGGSIVELSPTVNEPESFDLGEKPKIKTLLYRLGKHEWYNHLIIYCEKVEKTGVREWFMRFYTGKFKLVDLEEMAKILREQNILPGIMREDVNYIIKVEYPVKYYAAFEEDKFIRLLESIKWRVDII